MNPAVAIVGGGISGLAAAYQLHTLGVPFVVLERGDRLGGVVMTERGICVGYPVRTKSARRSGDRSSSVARKNCDCARPGRKAPLLGPWIAAEEAAFDQTDHQSRLV